MWEQLRYTLESVCKVYMLGHTQTLSDSIHLLLNHDTCVLLACVPVLVTLHLEQNAA